MNPSLALINHDSSDDTLATTQLLKEGIQSQSVTVTSIGIKSATDKLSEMNQYDGFIFNQGPSATQYHHEFTRFKHASLNLAHAGIWQNKVAAGLVPHQLFGMERITALLDLSMFCARHHMIWVSNDSDDGLCQYQIQPVAGDTVLSVDDTQRCPDQIAYQYGQKIAGITRLWFDGHG